MSSRARAEMIFSGLTSAMGWTLMCSLMMNSIRARPTPSFGSMAVRNASSGLPRFSMISVRGRLTSLEFYMRGLDRQRTLIHAADFSLGARDRYHAPFFKAFFASAAPTTAGIPSSRATIAAWHVLPPRSVTIPAEIFITGSQSGVVNSATRTSPGLKSAS